MSSLSFNRGQNKISLLDASGNLLAQWDAANIVDSHTQLWQNGTYNFSHFKSHTDDFPDSSYGAHGIAVFDTAVLHRTGLGVHSGRANTPDGLGRKGYLHATYGCVRTSDEAMARIVEVHRTDPLSTITLS